MLIYLYMKYIIIIIIGVSFMLVSSHSLMAGGELIKLKAIADSMTLQEQVLKQESENYKKAEGFINSPEVKKGVSSDFVLERCGKPVVRLRDDMEWVYKPPASSFFEGEKIYFVFDQDKKLLEFRKTCQQ